jgi:hypothetical protein
MELVHLIPDCPAKIIQSYRLRTKKGNLFLVNRCKECGAEAREEIIDLDPPSGNGNESAQVVKLGTAIEESNNG